MRRQKNGRNVIDEMNRVLDVRPAVLDVPLAGDARVTRRWGHGAIHDGTAAMTQHVAMTYYGAPQRIEWRSGARTQRSLTRSGSITVIPATHEARWDVYGPIEVSHVYLPDSRIRACADALGTKADPELVDRVGFDEPIASRLLQILALEADVYDPSRRLGLEQTVDLLCMRLVQANSVKGSLSTLPKTKGLSAWQVKKTTDYLNDHLDEPVGLDELAALVGLTRHHFCTSFRLATGLPPHRWLLQRRMAEASRLLREPSRSVTEIGLAVGYASTSAFIAAFRKERGVTPQAFRRGL